MWCGAANDDFVSHANVSDPTGVKGDGHRTGIGLQQVEGCTRGKKPDTERWKHLLEA